VKARFVSLLRNNPSALALAVVVIVITFYFHGGVQGIRAGKMLALVIVASMLWAWTLARKVSWSAGALMAVAALSAVSAGFGPTHAPVLVFVTCGTFLMWWCAEVGIAKSRPVLWAFVGSAVLQALYGFAQTQGIDPIFVRTTFQDQWLPVGTLGQQTLYGPFLAAACGAAIFLEPVLLVVLLPAALLTLSSMTFLSLCAVAGVYVVHRAGLKIAAGCLALLIVLGAGAFFLFPSSFAFDDQGRFQIWRSALKLWSDRPFFGYGLGSYPVLAPLDQSVKLATEHGYFIQAHNDYVQVLFETGLLGFLVVLGAFFEVGRGIKRTFGTKEGKAWTAVFAAIAANALGNFTFHVAPLALIGILSWSFLVSREPAIDGESTGG